METSCLWWIVLCFSWVAVFHFGKDGTTAQEWNSKLRQNQGEEEGGPDKEACGRQNQQDLIMIRYRGISINQRKCTHTIFSMLLYKNVHISSFLVSFPPCESSYLYSSFLLPYTVNLSAKTKYLLPICRPYACRCQLLKNVFFFHKRAFMNVHTKVASGIRMARWSVGLSESQRTRTFFWTVAYTAGQKSTSRNLYPRQQHSLPINIIR